MSTNLHVVIGLLFNEENDILIALRPPHVASPGVWEFPGGKIEKNEAPENALIREFQEEIGITITDSAFFQEITFLSQEKNINYILHVFKITQYSGVPYGRENQEIKWVPIRTLKEYEFPKANTEIINKLFSLLETMGSTSASDRNLRID